MAGRRREEAGGISRITRQEPQLRGDDFLDAGRVRGDCGGRRKRRIVGLGSFSEVGSKAEIQHISSRMAGKLQKKPKKSKGPGVG